MSDRDALLRAIIDNPADDAPRLVYADWLDEHGDPDRAEFIRLTAGRRPAGTAAEAPSGGQLEAILLRNADTWRAEAPDLPGVTWGRDLNRGFVHQASFYEWERFVAVRDQLFEAVPLDDLGIDGATTEACEDLATDRRLLRVRVLTLCGRFGDDGVVAIVSSPHIGNLHTLYLSGGRGRGPNSVTDRGGRAIVASPHLRNLRRLHAAGYAFSTKLKAEIRARFPEAIV